MKNKESGNFISRRQFIGNVMLVATGAALISARKTSRYQIACYTRPWAKHDYRVALDGIAEAGFKYVGLNTHNKGRVIDLNTPPEVAVRIGEEIKSRGLKIVTLSGGTFDAKKPVNEGIIELKRIIDNSVSCGSSNIQINDNNGGDTYYKVIAECCDYAAGKGVRITVKPHGSSGIECRRNIEKVGHKNFKLWYDPGNVSFFSNGKVNPVVDAADLDGFVVGMAVKDFRLPKSVDVTPGTGIVDFPALLATLQQGGFKRGPLVVECTNPGDVAYITAEAKKARMYIEELTK